jgi:hypothetical protein
MTTLGRNAGPGWLIFVILVLLAIALLGYAMGDSIPSGGWVIKEMG